MCRINDEKQLHVRVLDSDQCRRIFGGTTGDGTDWKNVDIRDYVGTGPTIPPNPNSSD